MAAPLVLPWGSGAPWWNGAQSDVEYFPASAWALAKSMFLIPSHPEVAVRPSDAWELEKEFRSHWGTFSNAAGLCWAVAFLFFERTLHFCKHLSLMEQNEAQPLNEQYSHVNWEWNERHAHILDSEHLEQHANMALESIGESGVGPRLCPRHPR